MGVIVPAAKFVVAQRKVAMDYADRLPGVLPWHSSVPCRHAAQMKWEQ